MTNAKELLMKNDTKPISDPADKVVEFIEALKNHMKWTLGNEPGCRKINVVSDAKEGINFTFISFTRMKMPS